MMNKKFLNFLTDCKLSFSFENINFDVDEKIRNYKTCHLSDWESLLIYRKHMEKLIHEQYPSWKKYQIFPKVFRQDFLYILTLISLANNTLKYLFVSPMSIFTTRIKHNTMFNTRHIKWTKNIDSSFYGHFASNIKGINWDGTCHGYNFFEESYLLIRTTSIDNCNRYSKQYQENPSDWWKTNKYAIETTLMAKLIKTKRIILMIVGIVPKLRHPYILHTPDIDDVNSIINLWQKSLLKITLYELNIVD